MRATLAAQLPDPGGRGTVVYEPKWDGFRALAFVTADRVALQSRQGRTLAPYFPDVTRLLRATVPAGTVLDGELIVWDADRGRTSFPALQRRLAAGRRMLAQTRALPAHYVAFDVLAVAAHGDLLHWPLTARRAVLEELLAAAPAQLQLCPQTRDVAVAKAWMRDWQPAGVEGVVVKPTAGRYVPGQAGWVKVKTRDTVDAIVGGVTGSLTVPQVLLLGRWDEHGRLRYLGQTLPVPVDRQPELAAALARFVAPGRRGPVPHPWPNPLPGSWTASFTDRRPLPYVPVQPTVVVEVETDTAVDEFTVAGPGDARRPARGELVVVRWRHRPRFVRVRTDLSVYDVA
ncbi:ATP-dependent DNA ligase [Dactylosporangium sp. NPDC048998]|uniref:ATP-dependent DNA ligase n=1 Tax=Dactylosporangium sp. NPDC048998 TaxID=3363976 RepID=UPI00370FE9BC